LAGCASVGVSAHAAACSAGLHFPLIAGTPENVVDSHGEAGRLLAAEFHLSLRAVALKLDVLHFQRHVAHGKIGLLLEVPLNGGLYGRFRLRSAGFATATSHQRQAQQANKHPAHTHLPKDALTVQQ